MKNYLDRYLAGETPLHPERLELPTEEELDAAEAEFDRIMAERESKTVADKKPHGKVVRLWPWDAAASVLLFVGVGAMLLTDRQHSKEEIVAKNLIDKSRDSVQNHICPRDSVTSIFVVQANRNSTSSSSRAKAT